MRRSLLLLTLAFVSACQSLGARTYNLGQLHDGDGEHKHVAALMGDTEYIWHQGFLSLMNKDPATDKAKSASKVQDPLETCVENLLRLAEIEPGTEADAARQVEMFARYALTDPWQISRQLCVEQLGLAGERLKLAQHPPAPEGTVDIATPDSLREALAPLVQALAPQTGLEPRGDIAAACRGIGQLHYDQDGILRALGISAALLGRQAADSTQRAPLLELVLDLERRTVNMALERAAGDTSVFVRAVAIEAGVRACDRGFLAKVMPRLGSDAGEEVPLAILAMVRFKGLAALKPGEDVSESAREGELALLIKVATEHPIDRVRVSAMQTLGTVSAAGFQSLREEDWDAWWHSHTAPRTR